MADNAGYQLPEDAAKPGTPRQQPRARKAARTDSTPASPRARLGPAERRLLCAVLLGAIGLALPVPAMAELQFPIAGLLVGIAYRMATDSIGQLRLFRD